MITKEQVTEMRRDIFADNKVTREEFNSLWEVKANEDETPEEFDALFAEAGMSHLAEDGKIDDEEADYLIKKINEDEEIDTAEEALLNAIAQFKDEGGEVSELLVAEFPDYLD